MSPPARGPVLKAGLNRLPRCTAQVTGLLDNPAALRAALLPLLLGVTAQAEARSALASVSQLPMLATPTALHFAGVSPFRSGWAAGSSVGRDKDYEAWVQVGSWAAGRCWAGSAMALKWGPGRFAA